ASSATAPPRSNIRCGRWSATIGCSSWRSRAGCVRICAPPACQPRIDGATAAVACRAAPAAPISRAMPTIPNTLALIGNTPLVRLEGPSALTGCDIFGKCEFANRGASVKDRAALFIVEDAEAKGQIQPGGTIVEGTAGNTGIGLALVANAKGYRTILVM